VTAGTVTPAGSGGTSTDVLAAILPTIDDDIDRRVCQAVAALTGESMSLSKNAVNYAPRVLKRGEPQLLGDVSPEDVETALRRLELMGRITHGEVGRRSGRKAVVGFAVAAANTASRANAVSEDVGGVFE
jgi:hypothetical protein